jgi:hypothetical protein
MGVHIRIHERRDSMWRRHLKCAPKDNVQDNVHDGVGQLQFPDAMHLHFPIA